MRVFPATRGCPIFTLTIGKEEETELLPIEPVSRTGRTDLKPVPEFSVFESVMDCFNLSFSDNSLEFWDMRSLFC